MSIATILAIGSGGFIGALLRAYFIGLINHHFPHTIPFGTLFVNVVGSFILGVLFYIFYKIHIPLHLKSLLSTGMMGAFTTYSTFAFETFLLIDGGNFLLAFLNILLNVSLTIFFAMLGYRILSLFW